MWPGGLSVLLHGVCPGVPQGARLQAEAHFPDGLLRLLGEVQVPGPAGGAPGRAGHPPQPAGHRYRPGHPAQQQRGEHPPVSGADRGTASCGAAPVPPVQVSLQCSPEDFQL
uniref:Uncharacterized protein n=1 Tax=Ixodes ricinus TaxID=34613 RepID=A0A6B0UJZ7_IXORI